MLPSDCCDHLATTSSTQTLLLAYYFGIVAVISHTTRAARAVLVGMCELLIGLFGVWQRLCLLVNKRSPGFRRGLFYLFFPSVLYFLPLFALFRDTSSALQT